MYAAAGSVNVSGALVGVLHEHHAVGVNVPTVTPFSVTVRALLAHSTPGANESVADTSTRDGVTSIHVKPSAAPIQLYRDVLTPLAHVL